MKLPCEGESESEYSALLLNHGHRKMWTKEETDKLFDLCDQFDLHFIVVADRFPTSRTVVELKNHYYSGILHKASAPSDVAGHPLVKVYWQGKYFILAFFVQEPEMCKILFLPEPYNVSHKVERKCALSMVLSQTKLQERRDAEVLAEAKRISKAQNDAKGPDDLEHPSTSDAGPEVEDKVVTVDSVAPSPNYQVEKSVQGLWKNILCVGCICSFFR